MDHLCQCGCGEVVTWNKRKKRWNRFIQNHSFRNLSPDAIAKRNETNTGHVVSQETRNKISKANIGKKRTDAEKQKMSLAAKNKPPVSATTRIKLSIASKGRKPSIETKKYLSDKFKGHVVSQETRNKISKVNTNPSKETRLKRLITNVLNSGLTKGKYCDAWYDKEYKNDLRKSYCEKCGITNMMSLKIYSMKLHTHHRDGDKTNCHPNNIKTLCVSCHPKVEAELRKNLAMKEVDEI